MIDILIPHCMPQWQINDHLKAYEAGLEMNVWAFVHYWEKMLQADVQPYFDIKFLFNEGFRPFLNGELVIEGTPNIPMERCVFIPDHVAFGTQGAKADLGAKRLEMGRLGLSGLAPEVVLSRTATQWLFDIFPDALHLSVDVGPFNRSPYPMTLFMDPLGYGRGSLPARMPQNICQTAASTVNILPEFRKMFEPVFLEASSSLEEFVARLRVSCKRVLVFAAQYKSIVYSPYTRFETINELLDDVLKYTPSDVALIFCPRSHNYREHGISDEQMQNLRKRYPNLNLVPPEIQRPYYTQALLPYVDGVVAVTSTVGLQAPVWGKHWFTSPECYYRGYVPSYQEIGVEIEREPRQTGAALLNWMLQRYSFPQTMFEQPDFLCRYLTRCLEEKAGRQSDASLFFGADSVATVEEILLRYQADMQEVR